MSDLKTSVRLLDDEADRFDALCHLMGKRRHQLAADLVTAGIADLMQDPVFADPVAKLVEIRQRGQAKSDAFRSGRTKGGLTLLGGDS